MVQRIFMAIVIVIASAMFAGPASAEEEITKRLDVIAAQNQQTNRMMMEIIGLNRMIVLTLCADANPSEAPHCASMLKEWAKQMKPSKSTPKEKETMPKPILVKGGSKWRQ